MNSSHRSGQRGATLVELALSLALLFMFVFGVIDFSEGAYAYHFVSDAAREATRYAMVRGSACLSLPDCNVNSTQVQDYVTTLVPSGINKDLVTVATTWVDPGTGQCKPPNGPGCAVNVKVTYTYKFNFPLISNLASIDMNSTSQMVISQ
jgi:Flp pilus assembly protein TadG